MSSVWIEPIEHIEPMYQTDGYTEKEQSSQPIPSEHDTLAQRWVSVKYIVSMYRVRCEPKLV